MEHTIVAKDGLLRARIWGRETRQPPFHVCKEIFTEANRLGLTRILLELTQKVPLSSAGQSQLIEGLPSLGMTPLHRIALVHHTPGFFEANSMIELMAENRGLNVKNFASTAEALDWLG
jgi:hypothetical protein